MLVEEGDRGRLVQCTVRVAVGAVVLWGEDFPIFYFHSFGLESFVEEGEER